MAMLWQMIRPVLLLDYTRPRNWGLIAQRRGELTHRESSSHDKKMEDGAGAGRRSSRCAMVAMVSTALLPDGRAQLLLASWQLLQSNSFSWPHELEREKERLYWPDELMLCSWPHKLASSPLLAPGIVH